MSRSHFLMFCSELSGVRRMFRRQELGDRVKKTAVVSYGGLLSMQPIRRALYRGTHEATKVSDFLNRNTTTRFMCLQDCYLDLTAFEYKPSTPLMIHHARSLA